MSLITSCIVITSKLYSLIRGSVKVSVALRTMITCPIEAAVNTHKGPGIPRSLRVPTVVVPVCLMPLAEGSASVEVLNTGLGTRSL